jgi:hypothetical protein
VSALVLEDPPLFVAEGLGENSLMSAFRLMRDSVPMLQEQNVPVADLIPLLSALPSASGAPLAEVVHPDAIEATARRCCSSTRRCSIPCSRAVSSPRSIRSARSR